MNRRTFLQAIAAGLVTAKVALGSRDPGVLDGIERPRTVSDTFVEQYKHEVMRMYRSRGVRVQRLLDRGKS